MKKIELSIVNHSLATSQFVGSNGGQDGASDRSIHKYTNAKRSAKRVSGTRKQTCQGCIGPTVIKTLNADSFQIGVLEAQPQNCKTPKRGDITIYTYINIYIYMDVRCSRITSIHSIRTYAYACIQTDVFSLSVEVTTYPEKQVLGNTRQSPCKRQSSVMPASSYRRSSCHSSAFRACWSQPFHTRRLLMNGDKMKYSLCRILS